VSSFETFIMHCQMSDLLPSVCYNVSSSNMGFLGHWPITGLHLPH